MALLFNTAIELESGITVNDAYGRVGVADNIEGTELQQIVEVFASEQAFIDGKKPMQLPAEVITTLTSAYDRATDGSDVLALAHANLQAAMADYGYTTTISL